MSAGNHDAAGATGADTRNAADATGAASRDAGAAAATPGDAARATTVAPDARAVAPLRALVFDVFGTLVDWHGSVAAEVARHGWAVDPGAFARSWRAGYAPAMQAVRDGRRPWAPIDVLHREILDAKLAEHGLNPDEPTRTALNRVWHRLDPWPDTVPGLQRLRARWPLATLSNGNVALLVDLVRHGALPLDAVFSAELFGHYKPDPEVYLGAARLLDVAPGELMLVAAHPSDLRAARGCGLRTALVRRPLEHGPGGPVEPWRDGEFDAVADDLPALARQLDGG